jgi:hypothetical protein
MPVLLRWPSLPCHRDDTGMSTTKRAPSRSVTYKGYKECILGPRASRRFPLWMLHPPDEKLVRKQASSSGPTEMSDRVSSGTCRTSWSTILEPPRRLSSTIPMPMTAQCCEFPTRMGSRSQAVYDQNWVRNGVTWYEAPESRSQLVASFVVRNISTWVVLSTLRMFGSSSGVAPTVLRKVVEDEPQKFTSSERLPLCVNLSFFALRARHSVLMCLGSLQKLHVTDPLDLLRFLATFGPRENFFHDVAVDHPYSIRCRLHLPSSE